MTEPSVLIVCIMAFIAVILVLSLLAVLFALLTRLFPAETEGMDAGVVAAINTAAAAAYPGSRITEIEEVR